MNTKKSEYDLQADKFLKETNTTLEIRESGIQKLANWQPHGTHYQVKLSNAKSSYIFDFWDSYATLEENRNKMKQHWKRPTAYDILASLDGYEPNDNIDDFASDFGYTKPSEALRVWEAVKEQYKELCKLFTEEELEKLREIH